MQAGSLKYIIEIFSPKKDKNEFGENTIDYVSIGKFRAGKKYNSGSRTTENNEIIYDSNLTFNVRKYVPIDEECQVKFNDNMYRILSLNDDELLQQKIIIVEKIQHYGE